MNDLSLYGQYILEREGKQILENEHGFFTFKFYGEECYIEDIFIKKDSRRSGIATDMANTVAEIARGAGCKVLTGTCVPSTHGATESMKAMFSYGFRIHSSQHDKIILIKEL
jgi:predicted GNAT family acetyltransferase